MASSQILSALMNLTFAVTPLQGEMDRPPLAGEQRPASAGGAIDGGGMAVDGAPAAQGGDLTFLYITFVLLGGLILFSILSSRKERKRREALLASIRKHDRVQTIGGIIGSVVEVKPDIVVIKVDEASNTRLTFARSAVQQVLKESPEPREVEETS